MMDINETSSLEMINRLIASDRLNKNQILQLIKLASVSNSFNELKENMKWETYKSKILNKDKGKRNNKKS